MKGHMKHRVTKEVRKKASERAAQLRDDGNTFREIGIILKAEGITRPDGSVIPEATIQNFALEFKGQKELPFGAKGKNKLRKSRKQSSERQALSQLIFDSGISKHDKLALLSNLLD